MRCEASRVNFGCLWDGDASRRGFPISRRKVVSSSTVTRVPYPRHAYDGDVHSLVQQPGSIQYSTVFYPTDAVASNAHHSTRSAAARETPMPMFTFSRRGLDRGHRVK